MDNFEETLDGKHGVSSSKKSTQLRWPTWSLRGGKTRANFSVACWRLTRYSGGSWKVISWINMQIVLEADKILRFIMPIRENRMILTMTGKPLESYDSRRLVLRTATLPPLCSTTSPTSASISSLWRTCENKATSWKYTDEQCFTTVLHKELETGFDEFDGLQWPDALWWHVAKVGFV